MPKVTVRRPLDERSKSKVRDLFVKATGVNLGSKLSMWMLDRILDAYPEPASIGRAQARELGLLPETISRHLASLAAAGWIERVEPGKGLLCADKIVEG